MKINFQIKTFFTALTLFCASVFSFAQRTTSTTSTSLSAEDKRSVISLFSNADRKYHRLQFNAGKEVYGTRTITSTEMERIRNTSLQEKGIIIQFKETNAVAIYLKDGTILFIAASGRTVRNPILSLLGKDKTAKLKTIMARYIDDADIKKIDNQDLLGAPDT